MNIYDDLVMQYSIFTRKSKLKSGRQKWYPMKSQQNRVTATFSRTAILHGSATSHHDNLMANNCQILGMYDKMSVMYGQLDAYKHSGSRLNRSTLLDLRIMVMQFS